MTLSNAEKTRRYREKHPERAKESYEKWKAKNPEYFKNYCKQWRQKNKEKVKDYGKKYLELNRENNKLRCLAYRKLREQIINERKKCEECGSEENLHLHHIQYKNEREFLKLLCAKCHRREHEKTRNIK